MGCLQRFVLGLAAAALIGYLAAGDGSLAILLAAVVAVVGGFVGKRVWGDG